RIAIRVSLSPTVLAFAPAKLSGRSTIANAKAAGLNRSDCREVWVAIVADVAPVDPRNVNAASFAGDAVTVCNCPDGMIDGLICTVPVPDPATSAVKTNCCKLPVDV